MTEATRIYVAVIDDDEHASRSLGRLLSAAGMQPIVYGSAEEFLADAKHPRFDCLVLDIQLGGMSGIELGQRLKTQGGRTPCIFITAHDSPEARAGADALGCAYFRKADSGADVLAAIRRVAV